MTNHFDDRLSELLSDAVSGVEPREALEDIRDRTRVTPITSRRPWLFATGGAVLATAAVITAIAFAGGSPTATPEGIDPGQSVEPNPPVPTEPEDSPPPTSSTEAPDGSQVVPVYWVSETPEGLRLYREFQRSRLAGDAASVAADLAVSGRPLDPDYRTLWPAGTRAAWARYDGDVIEVNLETADVGSVGLRERPDGMTSEEAALSLEQVIYTAQAAIGKGRAPVQLLINGERTDLVLGQPASEPLANGPVLDTLARVSLTTPEEGQTVTAGSPVKVTGVANSFEANVVVRLQRPQGGEVLVEPFTATGYMEEKLFPFEGTLDLSDVTPGTYVLSASTDDPSGQGLSHTDTRTIVVE